MLIFHEGLPGSGKSYEALISHIIPSIAKGRKVFARINGLNYKKIAELTDKTEEEVRGLLFEVSEEQVLDIHQHVENDSMVILDELQNFFPAGRGKLSDGITKFVTEHRHRGLDIVAMGQSIADVHNLWRRRTQRKIQFLKLDMVGMAGKYKWTAFQGALNAKGDVTFTKIKSGTRNYEAKYFGSYASHQADTENTDNLADDRLNIFKAKAFTVYLPAFLVLVGFAIWYMVGFFSEPPEQSEKGQTVQQQSNDVAELQPVRNAPVPKEESKRQKASSYNSFDFLTDNNVSYESKITYLSLRGQIVWDMIVVWYDKTGRVIDRVTLEEIKAMGYHLKYLGYGVQIQKDDYTALYRFKPRFQTQYSVPREVREDLHTDS